MTLLALDARADDRSVAAHHTTYRVEEWAFVDVPTEHLLDAGALSVYPDVERFFTLRPRHGHLQLQAQGWIGVVPLNDRVSIEVTPRVPLRNLSRLLRIAADDVSRVLENTARMYELEGELYPSLVDLYARALASHVERIANRGLLREYVQRREVTSFPHGRILIDASTKSLRPRDLTHKVATSWYERSADNAVNCCIKYAIWFLARHRQDVVDRHHLRQSQRVRSALNKAYRVFDGVTLDRGLQFLDDAHVNGRRPLPQVRAYYRPVLDLCRAIIAQQSVSLDRDSGDIGLPSLVIELSRAFEIYTRRALTTYATSQSWRYRVLDGNVNPPNGGADLLFDSGDTTMVTPDIVIADDSGPVRSHPVVIEVKYKPSSKSLDRDSLNQAVAYGFAYRARKVVVVRPKGRGDNQPVGLRALGSIQGIDFHHYVYDLEADDLELQEAVFGESVGALLGT